MAAQHFDVERLKDIPISSVVSRFDELHKTGCQYVALCPNPEHNDHHPSLYLNEKTGHNYCHCFACGFGGSTIDYLMARNGWTFAEACEYLSAEFGIPYLDGGYVKAPDLAIKPKIVMQENVEVSYVPPSIVNNTVTIHNSFSECLAVLYGPEIAARVTRDYRIGALGFGPNPNDTIFWNVDENGRVLNGKVQRYCTDPKSIKFGHCQPLFDDGKRSYWLSNWLRKQLGIAKDATFSTKCLFGAHLLAEHPDAAVIITESPKNAATGSAINDEFVWVATGNKGDLTPDMLQCLQGRVVTVYPDRDAIEDWTKLVTGWKVDGTINDLGIKSIFVNNFCKRCAPDDQPKYDIGDFFFDIALKNIANGINLR